MWVCQCVDFDFSAPVENLLMTGYRYFVVATPGNEKSAEYVKNSEIVQQARTDLYCPQIGKIGRTDLIHWSGK